MLNPLSHDAECDYVLADRRSGVDGSGGAARMAQLTDDGNGSPNVHTRLVRVKVRVKGRRSVARSEMEEEEGTLEADVERLRKMKLVEKPKVGAAPLAMEGEEQEMEVDLDEEDEGEAGVPLRLGIHACIHGPMERSGNTLCFGYGGYFYSE